MAWPSTSARTKTWGTEVLTASDLQGQFDLLHTYNNDQLNGTTGHGHTGGTNDGPKLSLTAAISGLLPIANGGTNLSSYAIGDVLYASASTTIAKLSPSSAGQALSSAGATTAPTFAGMTTQGDVEYHNGTQRTALAAGTNKMFLKTQGAAANPAWGNIFSAIIDYGVSASASTTRLTPDLKIAFGAFSLSGGTNQAITNLGFSSSSSYIVVGSFGTATDAIEATVLVKNSGAQFTIYNNDNLTQLINWFAIGI